MGAVTALTDLVELLALEAIEVNVFRGNSPDEEDSAVVDPPGLGARQPGQRKDEQTQAHPQDILG